MVRRVLNVAEKPSAAKEIARILSDGHVTMRPGLSQYNHVWEFDYTLNNTPVRMVFTSVSGHLMSIDFTPEYKAWHSCSPEALFKAPIQKEISKDKHPLAQTLQREAKSCQQINLWLDCDREGENIAFEVLMVVKQANPRIIAKRARFSALIPRDLHNACQRLEEPNVNQSDAVDCRQEIDLRLGAAFTRFQTQLLKRRFPAIENVVSWGPCQFPTLGFVVEAYKARESFVPELFWKIDVSHRVGDSVANFNWSRHRLYDRLATLILYEIITEGPPIQARVTSLRSQEKRKWRPVPLATVEFQKRIARLRISSQRAMEIAEGLYNKGLISYPRTETEIFKEGTDLQRLIEIQTESKQWGDYASRLLAGGFVQPRAGKGDDSAHPPIHPTKFVDNLQGDDKQVYDFITRHFLACCSQDAIGKSTDVTIEVRGGEFFHTQGLMITAKNYLDVYPYDKWFGNTIPVYEEGQVFVPTSVLMTDGETTPPKLLDETALITKMDKNGIGTDATIAQHIATIQDRQYAVVESGYFKPTDLGLGLVNGYSNMALAMAKPHLRSAMERDLVQITRGLARKQDVIDSCLEQMKKVFDTAQREEKTLEAAIQEFFQPVGGAGTGSALASSGNATAAAQLTGTGGSGEVLAQNFTNCKCGRRQQLKQQGKIRFVWCSTCETALNLPENGSISPHTHVCPICQYQVVAVTKPESGATHTVCPHCFTHPPEDQKSQVKNAEKSFRCFQCNFAECALATRTSDDPVRQCPACKDAMILRSRQSAATGAKAFFLSCRAYPACKTSFSLLAKSVTVPPHMDLDYEGCVAGCDEQLTELFRLNEFKRAPPGTAVSQSFSLASTASSGSAPSRFTSSAAAGGGGGSFVWSTHESKKSHGLFSSDAAGRGGSRGGRGGGRAAAASSGSGAAAMYDGEDMNDDDNADSRRGRGKRGSKSARTGSRSAANGTSRSRNNSADGRSSGRGRGRPQVAVDPSGGGRGSIPANVQCYQCGGPHYANACPQRAAGSAPGRGSGAAGGGSFPPASRGRGGGGAAGGGGGNECFICHQVGHWSNNCPQRAGGGANGPRY